MSELTPGYLSVSKTKESGAAPQTLNAGVWTPLDLGLQDFPDKQNINHAQVYYERIPAGGPYKFSIRTSRGNGNDTGQHDFLVKGPVWAIAYTDIDFVKHSTTDDGRRGIEVWAEVACVVQTRIQKGIRPLASDGDVS